MWYVYILECANDSFYTGITQDVEARVDKHRSGKGGSYTRAFGVKRLVYQEACGSHSDALKREAEIKRWPRQAKLDLIRR